MKILGLFAIFTIIGLGQGHQHQFPDFGKGPLHEDLQDFLDLVPLKGLARVIGEYFRNDVEIRAAVEYLSQSSLPRDLMMDIEAIPEVINFFNYLHNNGIQIYEGINTINRALHIKELVPPSLFYMHSATTYRPQKTGCGLAGFFKDIKRLFENYDEYITLYAKKMAASSAFANFIHEIKSDNFQQIINKLYVTNSFQTVINGLHFTGVETKIVADILYVVFGLTIPKDSHNKTLMEELLDFVKLIPVEKMAEILNKYMTQDEKVKHAFEFLHTSEFHTLLRGIEALREHQAMVIFMENTGLPVIEGIQRFHEYIGMEPYVPPEAKAFSNVNTHEVGGGMKAMLQEMYEALPLDEIDALYKEKIQNSKVFSDFIEKLKSPELQEIVTNLYNNEIFQDFLVKTREEGLELQGFTELVNRIFGITFPSVY